MIRKDKIKDTFKTVKNKHESLHLNSFVCIVHTVDELILVHLSDPYYCSKKTAHTDEYSTCLLTKYGHINTQRK